MVSWLLHIHNQPNCPLTGIVVSCKGVHQTSSNLQPPPPPPPPQKRRIICVALSHPSGLGFDRHLFALRVLAESEDKEVAFFQDPCYAYMNDIILSTSTLSSDAVLLGGFAPVSPTGYGIAYVVMDEWMGVQVSSYPTRDGKMMLQHLEQVFDDLHTVLTSSV